MVSTAHASCLLSSLLTSPQIFEMMTGDYLFDPKASGTAWNKDDDHLAQIMELLGDLEWEFKMGGRYSREIFNRKGLTFFASRFH